MRSRIQSEDCFRRCRVYRRGAIAAFLVATALSGCNATIAVAQSGGGVPFDWRSDWAVRKGLAISRDASGFVLPTAIAFVPSPGKNPKDPLYFVAELHGTVKVVSNDRTVTTFAKDFFRLDSVEVEGTFPSLELGMGGLCLDPASGYVYVTFVYHDERKVLRNNIARFSTVPEVFAAAPHSIVLFTDIFARHPSAVSHQIGQCQVQRGQLFVGVGDALLSRESQSLSSPLGKILRMTLDGAPAKGNPFHRNADRRNVTNYIWAYGLRNPFGLRLIGDRLFAADNGNQIDRLVEIRRGHNYLWDGNDRSISTNAFVILVPGRGLTHMTDAKTLGPAAGMANRVGILQAVSGDSQELSEETPPQILEIEYDLDSRSATTVPRAIVRYQGTRLQTLVGLASGPDGFYFAGMFPDQSDTTSVYRVARSPIAEYPYLLDNDQAPSVLMREYGCFGCHSLSGSTGGLRGPPLDREILLPRLEARLDSRQYLSAIAVLDSTMTEPFVKTRPWRSEVARTVGRDRLLKWVAFHIQEPKFDNPNSQMPNVAVSADHAEAIAEFLVGRDSSPLALIAQQGEALENADREEPSQNTETGGLFAQMVVSLLAFIAGVAVTVAVRKFRH